MTTLSGRKRKRQPAAVGLSPEALCEIVAQLYSRGEDVATLRNIAYDLGLPLTSSTQELCLSILRRLRSFAPPPDLSPPGPSVALPAPFSGASSPSLQDAGAAASQGSLVYAYSCENAVEPLTGEEIESIDPRALIQIGTRRDPRDLCYDVCALSDFLAPVTLDEGISWELYGEDEVLPFVRGPSDEPLTKRLLQRIFERAEEVRCFEDG